jgi:hypothetical protein
MKPSIREEFEKWFTKKYDWQIRRGSYGRQTPHLKMFEGEYISDQARNDWEVYQAAVQMMEVR